MAYENLILAVEESIGTITINRPSVLNALNTATLQELKCAALEMQADDSVKVIILTGAERAFAAGADISEMMPMTAIQGAEHGRMGQDVFSTIENLGKPVIAAVNGFALGGGCELAMACDIRVASEKAKFGQPEVKLGVTPGFGGTQRLPRLVGRAKAKELIFTGDMIGAAEAHRIGLVNSVFPPEELMGAARKLATQIAANGEIAVSLCKRAINQGIEVDLGSGCALEAEIFGLCFSTEDQKEGMKAFIEKRRAEFKRR
ncbi:MAG: enoyl-CoA hydratase/isomerase family protein [Candidatus Thermoplasmatota archaeon]|nr:crotonase [Euryarchaeota archaeon]MBU4032246.1 enoyl-CoA hydratase/isomerase family protein [Candidatus Thermoplasmatota archaeon]MBU4071433.1 enoyl-CoA hydratase/isomerase family protein [Candidatus Thermoplasmatota archaeon]MBU4144421.1 enoyl-CoA hydratase/isomerase family protein [Candidatus Thermoplasmatota archaeon]MBU4591081.1 enoyl-CoA hydratase/isomerase family protein [Candidatus Thermoplasmatota archaeon]